MMKLLKEQNKQFKNGNGYRHTIIHLATPRELDYEANYMGTCECGCEKPLYKGMSVVNVSGKMIYIDCLEAYLKRNLVVL